mmetsp:Transcript_95343/g.213251  ORF Transcript_95343/g.213251 Transcript_95343/m.213251 type:complete len:201 (+) Transcript_95343:206-808(+)
MVCKGYRQQVRHKGYRHGSLDLLNGNARRVGAALAGNTRYSLENLHARHPIDTLDSACSCIYVVGNARKRWCWSRTGTSPPLDTCPLAWPCADCTCVCAHCLLPLQRLSPCRHRRNAWRRRHAESRSESGALQLQATTPASAPASASWRGGHSNCSGRGGRGMWGTSYSKEVEDAPADTAGTMAAGPRRRARLAGLLSTG